MPIMNTRNTYGFVAKFLHWALIILILVQLYTIIMANYILPHKSPLMDFYIDKLHKPFGMLTLIVGLMFILWRMINIRPAFPPAMASWEIFTARTVHILLYLCLIVMPVTGLLMSVAGGNPPNFFGLYQVPMFMEKNEAIAKFFFGVHGVTAIILIGLVALHILAALKHHFINRDQVLRRMMY